MRCQGITIYSSANIETLFAALCGLNKKVFDDEEGVRGITLDFQSFVQNKSRNCERATALWYSRKRATNQEDDDIEPDFNLN